MVTGAKSGPTVWTSELNRPGAVRRRLLVVGVAVLALAGGVAGSWWWLNAPEASTGRDQSRPVDAAPRLDRPERTSDGEPVTFRVLDATQVVVTRRANHGEVAVRGTDLTYRPAASHIGSDTVGVRACNDDGCADLVAKVRIGRPGLSALTSVETRGLIRRADQPLRPGTEITGTLPAGVAAVAVSVTVHDARRPGAVTIDGGAGRVAAVGVKVKGATTSNVVIVPVTRRELVVRDDAGGGLTVDIVGTFTPTDEARAGRFVGVRRTRVAELDTAVDGRDATVPPRRYGAQPGIRAALVLVTAEIGTTNAWVDFGRSPHRIDRTMTWGPGKKGLERRSVALVPVNARGEFSMNYQHGSRVTVDVLGYFTGSRDQPSTAGLYVPQAPETIFDGKARADGEAIAAPAPAAAVVVTLAGTGTVEGRLSAYDVGISANRTIGTVLPVTGGQVRLQAERPLAVRVRQLGYFVR